MIPSIATQNPSPPAPRPYPDLLFGVRAIAAELGLDERRVYELLQRGAIPPAEKIGGRWAARRSLLLAMFDGGQK